MTAKRATTTESIRRAAIALDRDPGGSWVAAVVHHGSRLLLLLVTAVAIYGLFPAPRLPDTAVLERGTVAPSDVIAEFDFDIPKSADELVREQVEAASSVAAIYEPVPQAQDGAIAGLNGFFATVDSVVAAAPPAERTEALADYLEANRLTPTPATVEILLDGQRRTALREAAARLAEHGYSVLLPNVFHRMGEPPFFTPPLNMSDPEVRAKFGALVGSVPPTAMEEDGGRYLDFLAAQLETDAKYAVYLARQAEDVERYRRDEALPLPDALDYAAIPGLSMELRQKLATVRPRTIGQADRIDGMTPAALVLVALHARRAG